MERAEEQNMFAHGLLPTLGIAVLALFIVVFRQVTAQVQAQRLLLKSEKELTVARDKALDASRLKSEFVANISHELRTPLSGILGMAELLTLKPLDHESIDISNHLLDSAKHLLTVVNDLLDFSKLEAGKVNLEVMTVSLRDLVNDVIKNSSPEARKKGLQLSEQVSHAVPKEIVADATRIKQVLLNMLHNAIKFTKIGSVQLDVSMTEEGMIKFSVTDTGIGVSRLIQDKLFQPFVQGDGSTTRVYGGTGLGLSVSRNLVQLMDGKIGVISVEGSGSTFWFSIPVLLPEQVTVMADLNTPAGKKDEDASAMEQPSEQAQESSATDISDPVDTVATEIANRLEPARGSGYEQAAETTESTKNPTSQPHEQTNVR
jgi:signal transduction histidine kinase